VGFRNGALRTRSKGTSTLKRERMESRFAQRKEPLAGWRGGRSKKPQTNFAGVSAASSAAMISLFG